MDVLEVPSPLTYRGPYTSWFYLPDTRALDALGDKNAFAWPMFDATLAAQQAGRGSFSTPEGCWLTHLVASSSQAIGFTVEFYDTERQELWTSQPIIFSNALGTARQPFWFRKPYRLPSSAQIQARVINLSAAANAIQIVGWGLRD